MIRISENNLDDFENVYQLGIVVFSPCDTGDMIKHHDKVKWRERAESGQMLAAYDSGVLVGFCISYEKSTDTFHIWNAGVVPEYRKLGVWRQMYELIYEHAKSSGYSYLTVNTSEDEFPHMYAFALRNHFTEIQKEMDSNGINRSKFRMEL